MVVKEATNRKINLAVWIISIVFLIFIGILGCVAAIGYEYGGDRLKKQIKDAPTQLLMVDPTTYDNPFPDDTDKKKKKEDETDDQRRLYSREDPQLLHDLHKDLKRAKRVSKAAFSLSVLDLAFKIVGLFVLLCNRDKNAGCDKFFIFLVFFTYALNICYLVCYGWSFDRFRAFLHFNDDMKIYYRDGIYEGVAEDYEQFKKDNDYLVDWEHDVKITWRCLDACVILSTLLIPLITTSLVISCCCRKYEDPIAEEESGEEVKNTETKPE